MKNPISFVILVTSCKLYHLPLFLLPHILGKLVKQNETKSWFPSFGANRKFKPCKPLPVCALEIFPQFHPLITMKSKPSPFLILSNTFESASENSLLSWKASLYEDNHMYTLVCVVTSVSISETNFGWGGPSYSCGVSTTVRLYSSFSQKIL